MSSLSAPAALPLASPLSLPCDAAPASADPRHHGPLRFFRKHLGGAYSLARSYWLHYVIGGNLCALLVDRVVSLAADNLAARYAATLAILLTLGLYGCWIFLALGTWTSAGRHVGRGGAVGWVLAARTALLCGLALTLFTVPTLVKTVRSHWDILAGMQPGPAPAFWLSADARMLVLEGGINDGAAGELERALARAPQVTTVVLASNGGWTREGRLIGEVIAARGLNTHVESECSSACTLAFLAGKVRSAREGAHLGFHLFGPGDRKTSELAVRKAYGRLGMETGFIDKINATSPERMWYPAAGELVRYRVLTQAQGAAAPRLQGPVTRM